MFATPPLSGESVPMFKIYCHFPTFNYKLCSSYNNNLFRKQSLLDKSIVCLTPQISNNYQIHKLIKGKEWK